MILLDESVVESQRQLLRSGRVPARQIGREVGRAGMKDDEIIPLLRRIGRVTFFTRDLGFFSVKNCSRSYCIACLAVGQHETAAFVRRILHHPDLSTVAKRLGKVIRATPSGIRLCQVGENEETDLPWRKAGTVPRS